MNRIIVAILILTIALSSVIYSVDRKIISEVDQNNLYSLSCESRTIQLVQIASNIRSLIDIANDIEFDRYENGALQSIDRFNYLSDLI